MVVSVLAMVFCFQFAAQDDTAAGRNIWIGLGLLPMLGMWFIRLVAGFVVFGTWRIPSLF